MIQMIVNVLVKKQSQHQAMTDEDEKIYRYGYILLCEVILNLIIALVIGIVYSKFNIMKTILLCMMLMLSGFF
mgnify:CR=1 FL=1